MNLFVRKHEKKINATLSCFDRMLFRGYLPIQSGGAIAELLWQNDIRCTNLKDFLSEKAGRVNDHAKTMARKLARPFQCLTAPTRKEDLARKMPEKDGIEHGFVCIFSGLEPCRSSSFRFKTGFPHVQSARRKCLFLCFYFMDRDFGLIHVNLQTWLPMQIQVYLNGHEWLARKLIAHRMSFSKQDNVLIRVEDWGRAQKFADRFAGLNWPQILERYARMVNPLLKDLLHGYQHYWVTSQSEYSTDIIFKNAGLRTRPGDAQHLRHLTHYPRRQSAKVSRILNRFRTHKLIAKIPRTRRWRVTDHGRQVMAASLYLRDFAFPRLYRNETTA